MQGSLFFAQLAETKFALQAPLARREFAGKLFLDSSRR